MGGELPTKLGEDGGDVVGCLRGLGKLWRGVFGGRQKDHAKVLDHSSDLAEADVEVANVAVE